MLRYVNGVFRLGLTWGGEVPFEHPGKSRLSSSPLGPLWPELTHEYKEIHFPPDCSPYAKDTLGRRTADGLLGASFTHCRQENGVTNGDFVIAKHSFTNRRTMRSRIGTLNALAASRNCTRKSARRPFDCQSRLVPRERPAHACNARACDGGDHLAIPIPLGRQSYAYRSHHSHPSSRATAGPPSEAIGAAWKGLYLQPWTDADRKRFGLGFISISFP